MIPFTPYRRGAVALVAALLALACATPVDEKAVERKLRVAGSSVPGLPRGFLVVPIHATSKMEAWTLTAEARGEDSTVAGRRLSHDLRREARRQRGVVVGGVYPDLTRAVVLDAFDELAGQALDGLTLVYVGDPVHAEELRLAARAHRAGFQHRSLP